MAMIERDYLMRQIQQLVRVLQQVLFHRQQGQLDEAHRTIQQAIEELDEERGGPLQQRSLREVVQFCRRDGTFQSDLATSIADLLKEEGDILAEQAMEREARESYARALLLYRRAMREDDATLPLNVGTMLSDLEAELGEDRVEEIEAVLDETTE